jgi:protein-tyrosine phosphatase
MRNVFWIREGVIGGRSGPNRDAWSPKDLAKGGVGAVLSVNDGELVRADELAEVGIDYCCVPLSDAAPPRTGDLEICVSALPRALSFALRSIECNRSVLVHCSSGKDRTGMLLSYFLCATERLSPSDAIREVRRVRPIALSADGWEVFAHQVLGELHAVGRMQSEEVSRRGSVA